MILIFTLLLLNENKINIEIDIKSKGIWKLKAKIRYKCQHSWDAKYFQVLDILEYYSCWYAKLKLFIISLIKISITSLSVSISIIKCKINININININIKSKVKLKLKASMRYERRISNMKMNIIIYTYFKKYLWNEHWWKEI